MSLVEITFTDSNGLVSTIVDSARVVETIDENRPLLDMGTTVTAVDEYGDTVYEETT